MCMELASFLLEVDMCWHHMLVFLSQNMGKWCELISSHVLKFDVNSLIFCSLSHFFKPEFYLLIGNSWQSTLCCTVTSSLPLPPPNPGLISRIINISSVGFFVCLLQWPEDKGVSLFSLLLFILIFSLYQFWFNLYMTKHYTQLCKSINKQ